MHGLVLEAVRRIDFRTDLPSPTVERPTDAIVEVAVAGLCGSDLHPYEGREPTAFGIVPGHELVGTVAAIGPSVRAVAVGDRVLAPFTTSCGGCGPCGRGLTARCEHGELFGYGPPAAPEQALGGGQAQQVRVPLADGTLVRLPDRIDDAAALLLTDNLPTGWEAVARAQPEPGEALVVVGLGAVGLCAVAAAIDAGADPVVGVDPVEDRRRRAARLGAAAVTSPDRAQVVRAAARQPEGFPVVVEAAGTAAAQQLAFELVQPGGVLSLISVQTERAFAFTPVETYDRNLTIRAGRASVRAVLDRLLPRAVAGTLPIPVEACVTHLDVPLSQGPELYRQFAGRVPGLVKVAFAP